VSTSVEYHEYIDPPMESVSVIIVARVPACVFASTKAALLANEQFSMVHCVKAREKTPPLERMIKSSAALDEEEEAEEVLDADVEGVYEADEEDVGRKDRAEEES
jgi:hypothetical protein